PPLPPDELIYERVRAVIENRVEDIDCDELDATLAHMEHIIQCWEDWEPRKYQDFTSGNDLPLMFPAGTRRNEAWGKKRGFPTPTSMRNVDASCEACVLENRYIPEEV
ncbi:MAG: hypothetical protein PHG06_21530, partial [Parabacteroides sp.]|nr:hypothetical protein [Parabacteroides sp.]